MSSRTVEDTTATLSSYGAARIKEGAKVMRHESVMMDAFNLNDNPNGIINLAVAENTLMTDYLSRYFKDHFNVRPVDFTYGDSLSGSLLLRTALSSFFNIHFHPTLPTAPSELIASSGLLPLISSLGRALVDPGNAVLIAAPYYHGFDIALSVIDSIRIIPVSVPLQAALSQGELDRMEFALQEAVRRGVKVQAVFLVNPQNPLGRCYSRDVLEGYARFAEQHDLHLVSDEVYALSTFPSQDIPHPGKFHSILSLDLGKLKVKPERVHMMYGMSKDFDANGFRAGVLHTRNKALYQSLLATSIFSMVSSPTAELWAGLLNDKAGLDEYVRRNREELGKAYEHLTGWLRFHDIPYIPSCAGHFLMADFRGVLSSPTILALLNLDAASRSDMTHREHVLLAHLSSEHTKVVVGPGMGFHMPEPGWFRLTFSLGREVVDEGLRRVERALGWERWGKLGEGLGMVEGKEGLKGEAREGVDSERIVKEKGVERDMAMQDAPSASVVN